MQVPSSYSALKIKGERAYKLAREGKKVDLPARPVTIYKLEITEIAPPFLSMTVTCSAGTYIRALGRDLGKEAGCLLTMSGLTRTEMGPFTLQDAWTLEDIEKDPEGAVIKDLHPILSDLPALELSEKEGTDFLQGKRLRCREEDQEAAAVFRDPVSLALLLFPEASFIRKSVFLRLLWKSIIHGKNFPQIKIRAGHGLLRRLPQGS